MPYRLRMLMFLLAILPLALGAGWFVWKLGPMGWLLAGLCAVTYPLLWLWAGRGST